MNRWIIGLILKWLGLIRKNNNINKEMLNVTTAQTEKEAKNIIWDVAEKAKSLNQNISAISSLMKYGEAIINTIF